MSTVDLPDIAFIGGGVMATAMIRGLKALVSCPNIIVAEPDVVKHQTLINLGCSATDSNATAVERATVVILAVKPQVVQQAVGSIVSVWNSNKVLISILAGTPISKIQQLLSKDARIIRAMPNIPLSVGKGMVGLCSNQNSQQCDLDLAKQIFSSCAKVIEVKNEEQMDSITAVSGSGPAYYFYFAEALVGAAQKLGFTRDEAILLVQQTGAGAQEMLERNDFEATRLRAAVTSPGGTTAAAIKVLEEGGFTGLIEAALAAAVKRGKELAEK